MKLNRPPYILAFPGDIAGCGFHRILRPLQIMGRLGYASGRADIQFPDERTMAAIKPDVIVWQRQSEDSQIEIIERYRKLLPEAHFVFELDDALSAVPKSSWHNPYMTPNIDAKLAKAISRCDVVTVSTEPLAEHMRPIAGSIPVRVVPNMLGRDDLELASQTRREAMRASPATTKLRVGFGGGIGHTGDLALLNPVFESLADQVEWCFLGIDPTLPPGVKKSFFGAVPPSNYLRSLASLNLDLIIAPLEDNLFNRCKSNLRMLESGACLYPVIATKIDPYVTDHPPVFSYAETPLEWIEAIRAFIDLPQDARAQHGKRMFDWVMSRYVMDDRVEERLLGWLPAKSRVFKPRLHSKGSGVSIVSDIDSFMEAFESSEDILYARPGAIMSPDNQERLLACDLDVGVALSNEGGPGGFPAQNRFTPIDTSTMESISKVMGQFEKATPIQLSALSGPVMLLRRKALDAIGAPDFSLNHIELSLLEWSSSARARGLSVGLCPSAFVGVGQPISPSPEDTQLTAIRTASRWPQTQSDEAALKALYQEIELAFHRENYRALPPANRSDYPAWAQMCDTRGPEALERAHVWARNTLPDTVIHDIAYPHPYTPDLKDGWFFLYPSGTELAADSTALMTLAISENPGAKLIYFDHDYTFQNQPRMNPDFKPNFDLHMLLSRDYISQALMIRRDLMESLFTAGAVIDSVSLYNAVLMAIADQKTLIPATDIAHSPHIIATLPAPTTETVMSEAPFKLASAQKFSERSGWQIGVEAMPAIPLLRTLNYTKRLEALGVDYRYPHVVIVIPCKDNLEMLAPCISTILTMTWYKNYRILLVDNGSTRQEMLDYQASLMDHRVVKTSWPHPYSWSELNNWAVDWYTNRVSKPEYLCFLNDDTRVLSPDWLDEMVGCASLAQVGAVGARLSYPHGQIQHVGVVAQSGMTGHIHKGLPINHPGVQGYAIISHESTAVTGACLVISAKKYHEVGGFSPELPHNFNDVAFCLDLYKRGYVNIVAARAELQHFEGVTRNSKGLTEHALSLLRDEGAILARLHPEKDPYWNPNLLIVFIQDGRQIAGMDQACYVFPGNPLPWTTSELQRLLLLGPIEPAFNELHDGYAIYQLEVLGNMARIKSPPMANSGPWDIRRPEIAAQALAKLGIDKIVLSQLDEAPVQTLQFLRKLNIPLEYRPVNAEAVCPRGDFTINTPNSSLDPTSKATCNGGFRRGGECQSCMDTQSSPHGNVHIPAWRGEWLRFLQPPVAADMAYLKDDECYEALKEVFSSKAQ